MGWFCAHPGARRIPRCQWGALPRKGTSLAPGRCQCTVAPSSRPPGASRSRGSTTGTLLRPRTMTRRRTDLVCRLALYPTVFSLFPLLMLTHTNRLSSGSFNTKSIDHCTIERKYRPSATFGKNHPLDKNRQDHTSGRKRPYRDILRLPVELDVKHNKRSNAGLRFEDSTMSTLSLSMSSLHDASRSTSMSRASSAYIKPITLRSRSKVRDSQRRRDRLRREKGHGSWKMDSRRFHPSKIFLKASGMSPRQKGTALCLRIRTSLSRAPCPGSCRTSPCCTRSRTYHMITLGVWALGHTTQEVPTTMSFSRTIWSAWRGSAQSGSRRTTNAWRA